MEYGKLGRATTFVVISIAVFALAGFEGCGGLVSSGSGGGGGGGNPSISGTVVDSSTKSPVGGALVVLEQPDGSGTDRVIASTTSASNGTFSFTPPATGVFDVVADASVTPPSAPTVTYAATVTFGVLANANLGQIPLVAEFGAGTPGVPTQLLGIVSSSGNSTAFGQVDVKLSALLLVSPAVGSVNQVTTPVFAGTTPTTVTTVTNTTCMSPAGTTCVPYSLQVPAGNFSFGTFSTSGTQYTLATQPQPTVVNYTVEGRAFVHMAGQAACSPSTTSSQFVVQNGSPTSTNSNLTFTGCF